MHGAERGRASRSKLGGDLQISPSFAARRCRAGVRGTGHQNPLFCFDNAALIEEKPPMAKKPGTNPKGEFAFFNVVYEDDSQRSNRRVPSELLGVVLFWVVDRIERLVIPWHVSQRDDIIFAS
jgi:hypothetical protein